MPADQAAGLRSRAWARAPRVVSLIDVPAATSLRIAQALRASAQKILLIDNLGRHKQVRNTQYLFGWQRQVAQQRLQTWPRDGVEVLHAPGARAGDAAIVRASGMYHAVLFDGYTLHSELPLATETQQVIVLDVCSDKLGLAYALLKTLQQRRLAWQLILTGEAAAAARLIEAAAHFLQPVCGELVYMNLATDAHLRAVAARISAADAGTRSLHNNTEEDCAQHG